MTPESAAPSLAPTLVFTDAAAAWRTVAERARVDDPLREPGTGLIAIASFAFSDHSSASSVLIVPSIVIGRRGGRAWVTRVDGDAATRWRH